MTVSRANHQAELRLSTCHDMACTDHATGAVRRGRAHPVPSGLYVSQASGQPQWLVLGSSIRARGLGRGIGRTDRVVGMLCAWLAMSWSCSHVRVLCLVLHLPACGVSRTVHPRLAPGTLAPCTPALPVASDPRTCESPTEVGRTLAIVRQTPITFAQAGFPAQVTRGLGVRRVPLRRLPRRG